MKSQEMRAAFPNLRDMIYMNTGQACPSPLAVLRHINQTLEKEALWGPGSSKGIAFAKELEEDARSAVSALIGAQPEDVRITHSTREGVTVVLYGINWRAGDELVICNLEHSTLPKAAYVLAERHGVKVVEAHVSPKTEAGEILATVKSVLNSKTRLIALSHIQFGCGLRMPIQEIGRLASQEGIPFLVDGAQSVGHIPVNVSELNCDFYALSGQKWLMGPVGTGALFVKKQRRVMLEPLFSSNEIEKTRDQVRPALAKFALVSHSPALVAGLAESIRLAIAIGISSIEQRVMKLSVTLKEELESISGCAILSPSSISLSSGLVTIDLDGWLPEKLVVELERQFNIVTRAVDKPTGVRFCTSYFNTDQELERVAEAIRRLAKEGCRMKQD